MPTRLSQPPTLALLIGVSALALHSAALTSGFVRFDDDYFVYESITVRSGLTLATVQWAFTETWGFWFPLTRLSHLLDVELWGLRPGGHHLTSVVLHALSSSILFWALWRLTRRPWPSALVAALFAVHPLNVETVAWISERKEVLCGLFFVATLWAYARYVERPNVARMAAVMALFALALMSKPMAVTLPAVLLLLDAWPLKRLEMRCLVEKAPLLALTVAFSVLAHDAQRTINAMGSWDVFPLGVRVSNALVSYAKYFALLVLPARLSPFYPHPYDTIPFWQPAAAAIGIVVVTVLLASVRLLRPALVGWLWWLGMFVPVIGLVQIGRQGLADHYAYLPSIGLFIAVAFCVDEHLRKSTGVRRARVAAALSLTVLVACGAKTVHQHSIWRDTETLFAHALELRPDNWLAHRILALERASMGRAAEAAMHLREAVKALDRDPQIRALVRVDLARSLSQMGRSAEALTELQQAVRDYPSSARTHAALGEALGAREDYAAAAEAFGAALALDENDFSSQYGLGVVLLRLKRASEALPPLQRAATLNPRAPGVHYHLGLVFMELGRPLEAEAALTRALELRPDLVPARDALGRAKGAPAQ